MKPFRWVFRRLCHQGPNVHHQLYPTDSARLPRWRLWATMAGIHLNNGPVACAFRTTCRNCRDHPCLGHLLEHRPCSGSSVPAEAEVAGATILTETTEVVLPDGPTTMTPMETTIDDHFVGLPTGALPGADPPVGDHQVDHPTATLIPGPCHSVIRWGRNEGRLTRSACYRCPLLPPSVRGKLR